MKSSSAKVKQAPGLEVPSRTSEPWIARHWLAIFNSMVGLFVLGALLAPALMRTGYTGPASALYALYGFTCHQLPQRSYFLFGQQLMYPLDKILSAWPGATDFFQQRAILGDPIFGYKVAIGNRCSAIYPSILVLGLLFGLARKRIRPISFSIFLALSLPMALDGGSHIVSEVTAMGFRDTNEWLRQLTSSVLPAAFYSGDALGSFNWLMRTITGTLFGLAVVWFAYPLFGLSFDAARPRSSPREP